MAVQVQSAWQLIKTTFSEYSEDRVPRLAASLAYYTVFAIAPMLIIAIAVAGFIFGDDAARGEVDRQLRGVMGEQAAAMIQTMIQNASRLGAGILATLVGVVILILAATGLFAELHDSLNLIWEVKSKEQGIWATVRARFLSFLMVLGIALLIMASLVASAVLSGMAAFLGTGVGGQVLNELISLAVFTLVFALVFKLLPDVKIRWSDVWIGALATAVLFTIGKYAIGLYLSRGTATSAFGAAGSLVALLVWVYYSAQILFLGAEFTQVYARRYGEAIEPSEAAEAVTSEERVHQGLGPRKTAAPAQSAAAARQGERYYPSVPVVREMAVTTGNGQSSSKAKHAIPLLVGLALGRMLLSRKKKPRPAPTAKKHFAPERVVEPGWVSRKRHTAEKRRAVLEKPLALGERITQRLARGFRSARTKLAQQT